jgi:hypothetical protein
MRVATRGATHFLPLWNSQEPNTDNLSKDEPSRPIGTPNEPSSPSAGTIFEEIGGINLFPDITLTLDIKLEYGVRACTIVVD